MAFKTKYLYAEEVINSLQAQFPNRDLKIDPRDIILRFDDLVNEAAKAGYLEHWKLGLGRGMDDQFVTTWEWLNVTDPANKASSYFQLPASYAALPNNEGIDQVYFKNDFTLPTKKYFDPVAIVSFKDLAAYRNTVGGELEGRISCYPRNGYIYFDRGEVAAKYGQIGLRLVVRDSSAIADDAPYPVPADKANEFVSKLVDGYRKQLMMPQDNIRDAVDKTPKAG